MAATDTQELTPEQFLTLTQEPGSVEYTPEQFLFRIREDEKKGTPLDVLAGKRSGAKRTWQSWVTGASDYQDMSHLFRMRKLLDQYDKGGIEKPEDARWLADVLDWQSKDMTLGAKTLAIGLDMIPWAQDFLIGKSLVSGGMRVAGKEALDVALAEWAKRGVTAELLRVGLTGAAVISAAELTKEAVGALGAPVTSRTSAETQAELMAIGSAYGLDEEEAGSFITALLSDRPEVVGAAANAGLTTLIEGSTEMMGGSLARIPPLNRVAALQHMLVQRLLGKGVSLDDAIQALGRGVAYDGLFQEIVEERASDVADALRGRRTWAEVFPEMEDFAAELIALGAPGAAGVAASRLLATSAARGVTPTLVEAEEARRAQEAPQAAQEAPAAQPAPEAATAPQEPAQPAPDVLTALQREPGLEGVTEAGGPQTEEESAIVAQEARGGRRVEFADLPPGVPGITVEAPEGPVAVLRRGATQRTLEQYAAHESVHDASMKAPAAVKRLLGVIQRHLPDEFQSALDEVRRRRGVAEEKLGIRALAEELEPEEAAALMAEALPKTLPKLVGNEEALNELQLQRGFLRRVLDALARTARAIGIKIDGPTIRRLRAMLAEDADPKEAAEGIRRMADLATLLARIRKLSEGERRRGPDGKFLPQEPRLGMGEDIEDIFRRHDVTRENREINTERLRRDREERLEREQAIAEHRAILEDNTLIKLGRQLPAEIADKLRYGLPRNMIGSLNTWGRDAGVHLDYMNGEQMMEALMWRYGRQEVEAELGKLGFRGLVDRSGRYRLFGTAKWIGTPKGPETGPRFAVAPEDIHFGRIVLPGRTLPSGARQQNYTLFARVGDYMARMDYAIANKTIYAENTFVPPEIQRQGVGTEMYKEVLRQHPGLQFGASSLRTTMGQGFREALERKGIAPAGPRPPSVEKFNEAVRQAIEKKKGGEGRFALAPSGETPPFYSALERGLEEMQQARFSAKQLDAMARKVPGVTDEELEWVGWDELLRGRKAVTKEEALEWVRAHQVEVRERVLSDEYGEPNEVVYDGGTDMYVVLDGTGRKLGEYETEDEADAAVRDAEPTQHGTYQLPGGERYRELLLTLPRPTLEETRRQGGSYPEYNAALEAAGPAFISSHFDQPNVLAHIRFNERTDAEGRRVMFLEEVQSDWHQEGRKKGYRKPSFTADEIETRFVPPSVPEGHDPRNYPGYWEAYDSRGNFITRGPSEEAVRGQAITFGPQGVIPDAPFKRSWPTLSLKRAIKWAADNGFDAVAWTTGAQQVERYETALRQGVDSIEWRPMRDAFRSVAAMKDGDTKVSMQVDENGMVVSGSPREVSGKSLEDVVGKSIAERILSEESGSIQEEGLTIGGKGMVDFYDKILVNAANKLGKRFGVRVGRTQVPTEGEPGLPQRTGVGGRVRRVTPEEAATYRVVEESPGVWAVYGRGGRYSGRLGSREEAERWMEESRQMAGEVPSVTVHSLPITPDMRATVSQQGFTTFGARFAVLRPEAYEAVELPPVSRRSLDSIRRAMQDAALPIERWEQEIDKRGGKALGVRDVISAMPGRVEGRAEDLKRTVRKISDIARRENFWGLGQGGATAMLGDVMYAQGAAERNAFLQERNQVTDGSGMSDAEAQGILDEHLQKPGVQDIVGMVRNVVDTTRDQMEETGLISKETADFWRQTFPNYVPMRTAEADINGPAWVGPHARGYQVTGPIVQSMQGRRSRADNPFVFALAQAHNVNHNAEKNRIGLRLWDTLQDEANTGLVSYNEIEPPPNPAEWAAMDAFTLFVNGERKTIKLSSPDVNRAMKKLGFQPVHPILRLMGHVTRFVGRTVTQWSPDFILRNFTRDLGEAMVNLSVQRKGLIQKDVLKSLPSSLRAIAAYEFRGRTADTELGRYYVDVYRKEGGLVGWASDVTFEQMQTNVLREMKKGLTARTMGSILELVGATNSVVEQGVRVSTAYQLEKAGVPREKAIRAARELTIDFNRRGEWTSNLAAWKMFINARIQGAAQMLINMKRQPLIGVIGTGIMATAFGTALMNFFAMGDDDDGESRYFKKPGWERNTYLMLPNVASDNPDDMVELPLAYGYSVFWAIGDALAEAALRKSQYGESVDVATDKVAPRMADAIWQAFSPISESTITQLLTPTAMVPFVQIAENKNWHGGPIMPDGNPFDPAPPPDSERAWSTVSPLAQDVARWLNKAFGGNRFRAGTLFGMDMSVSPESLEHVYESYLGGLGKFAERSYKLATKPWSETGWGRVPIIRSFYSDYSLFADQGSFYENVEEVHRAAREVEGLGDKAPARSKREAELLNAAKRASKKVKDLRAEQRTEEDPDRRQAIEEELRKAFLDFNGRFNKTRRP